MQLLLHVGVFKNYSNQVYNSPLTVLSAPCFLAGPICPGPILAADDMG